MAIDKLSIGEVNSGPFNAVDSLIERLNAGVAGGDKVANVATIADTSTATATAVGDKVNELIAALITAGVMAAS